MQISNESIPAEKIDKLVDSFSNKFAISKHEASYFISNDIISSNMYNEIDDSIDILYNDGTIKDISEASDMLNIQLLSKKVEKHYFSYLRI